eukprot:3485418-Alexandrium_andersonii.AAC.1
MPFSPSPAAAASFFAGSRKTANWLRKPQWSGCLDMRASRFARTSLAFWRRPTKRARSRASRGASEAERASA